MCIFPILISILIPILIPIPISHVDVDVDPCSFLAFEAIAEDDDLVASRGDSEMNCLSKGLSIVIVMVEAVVVVERPPNMRKRSSMVR